MDSTIVAQRICNVNLKTLREVPFNLKFDDFVVVKISSKNSFGWSVQSQPNSNGAKILTEPEQMNVAVYKPLLSTGETMVVYLSAMLNYEETCGSTVDSYKVEYKEISELTWTTV